MRTLVWQSQILRTMETSYTMRGPRAIPTPSSNSKTQHASLFTAIVPGAIVVTARSRYFPFEPHFFFTFPLRFFFSFAFALVAGPDVTSIVFIAFSTQSEASGSFEPTQPCLQCGDLLSHSLLTRAPAIRFLPMQTLHSTSHFVVFFPTTSFRSL